MGTLLELKTRIAQDLTRDDLTSQIANAVSDAARLYARERFWFNTTRTMTFNTVVNQTDYGTAALAAIPNFVRIDALFLPRTQSIYPLDRYEAPDFEVLSGGMSGGGRPTAFTYIDQMIRLWPTPNMIYALRIIGHYKLPLPADSDTNAWTDDAEELIRSHAKMLLYTDVLEDTDGMSRMASKIPMLLGALRSETSARSSTGIIAGTQF
jgi:hypothetical protein